MVTVDGTDFLIQEPIPFSSGWYAKKFNKSGLRYEIAICILTGDIVGYNGPFPCGTANDLSIFRYRTKRMLDPGEKVVADGAYQDVKCAIPLYATSLKHHRDMAAARARHETVNRKFKEWQILGSRFRHHRSKHHIPARAVFVMTQIAHDDGRKAFQVGRVYDPLYD